MINGSTSVISLIGHPVSHSFSPKLHNHLFDKYNLNYKYVCFDVLSENVEYAVKGIKALGIKGSNVTVPHKVAVMEFLDEISKEASIIGAVNTIKNENGKLVGYNTDGAGFVKSVLDKGFSIKDKNVMILGAGGASRSIIVALSGQNPKCITIRNRNLENAKMLAEIIDNNFDVKVDYADINVKESDLYDIDILINTTSLGMSPNIDSIPIDENIKVCKDMLVCDIVYNPKDTKFLKWAFKNNLDTLGGKSMLINQGLMAFNIWTGISVSENDIKDLNI